MADRAKLVDELKRLDGALRSLAFGLQLAKARRQFLGTNGEEEERRVLSEMDRLMTRIRAVEGKLAMIDRGEKLRFQ